MGSTVLWKPAACVLCPSDLEQENRIWANQWKSIWGKWLLIKKHGVFIQIKTRKKKKTLCENKPNQQTKNKTNGIFKPTTNYLQLL